MRRPAKGHSAELQKYPELNRFPERYRMTVFRCAPSDQRARRSRWLKVIVLKRKGPEYMWGRSYKVKNPGGPELVLDSKRAVREFLHSKGIPIVDEFDVLKTEGHGAGRLVSEQQECIELEDLPPPSESSSGVAVGDRNEGVANGTEAEGDEAEEEGSGDLDEEEVDEEEVTEEEEGIEGSTEENDRDGIEADEDCEGEHAASDVVGDFGGGQEIPSRIEGFGSTSPLAPEECAGNTQDGMNTLHVRSQISELIDNISWRLKVAIAVVKVSGEDRLRLKGVSNTVEQLKALLISAEFTEQERIVDLELHL